MDNTNQDTVKGIVAQSRGLAPPDAADNALSNNAPSGKPSSGTEALFTISTAPVTIKYPNIVDLTTSEDSEGCESQDGKKGLDKFEDNDEPHRQKFRKGPDGQRSGLESGPLPLPSLRNDHWNSLLPLRDSRKGEVPGRPLQYDGSLVFAQYGYQSSPATQNSSLLVSHSKGKVGRPRLTEAEKLRRKIEQDARRRPRGRPRKTSPSISTSMRVWPKSRSEATSASKAVSYVSKVDQSSPALLSPSRVLHNLPFEAYESLRTAPREPTVNLETSKAWMKKHADTEFVQQLLCSNNTGPPITIVNDLNGDGPPSGFKFIQEYVFTNGTNRIDPQARYGCTCRPENGRNVGCEYRSCLCIEDAARDSNGKPMGFAYHAIGDTKGCLRNMYLEQRFVIYECNDLCNCPAHCKNKVVQRGRQVPLEIFKTKDRGWGWLSPHHGLRSPVFIRKGQFVDVYLGEVLTDAEAKRREHNTTIQKDSYLFALDKFHDIQGSESSESSHSSHTTPSRSFASSNRSSESPPPNPNLFIVDGEHMGGPTRFINHSCSPNLRIFAVSMVRGDPRVYELAFFAIDDIQAGEELTFDYLDRDDEEEEDKGNNHKKTELEHEREGMAKCRCGAENCRGWLWI